MKKVLVLLITVILLLSVMPFSILNISAESGKTYYVASNGSDSNDGLSESKPISFSKANSLLLKGGDKLLFKRGDTFYGEFMPVVGSTTKTNRVEIGAYGKGAKPILSKAKIVDADWQNAGNGFYKFELSKNAKYDGFKDDSANVGFFEGSDGVIHGERKENASLCTKKYDFYCDDTSVYIKTDKEPHKDLGKIKMCIHGSLLYLNTGITVRDLHLQYAGYGMSWNPRIKAAQMQFADIYNCIFERLGGTNINSQGFTRGGNGIELYNGGQNVIIRNNLFRNIYDVGFTCQGNDPGVWRNITVNDNIFTYCTQAMEHWCGNTNVGGGIYALEFNNNLCIKNGESWASLGGTPRINSTDILVYTYIAPVWQVSMQNNTFYHSTGGNDTVYYIHSKSVEKFLKLVSSDNNYIYHINDKSRVLYTDNGGTAEYDGLILGIDEWRSFSGKDKNSSFTAIGDNLEKYKKMEKTAYTSLDFNEIVKSAVDSGLTVKAVIDEDSNESESDNAKNDSENSEIPWLYIIIGAAAIIVIITVVVIVVVVSSKSKKK